MQELIHFTTSIQQRDMNKIQGIDIDAELNKYYSEKGDNIVWAIESMSQSMVLAEAGLMYVTTTLLVNYRSKSKGYVTHGT